MGSICRIMVPECVLIDPREQEKEGIIREMVDTLSQVHNLAEPEQLFRSILEREELSSTCIGFGCAVPHAHTPSLDTTLIAAARLNPPRDFGASDGELVSLVFLMAGPDNRAGVHIRLLSRLVRLLHDGAFREELRGAEDSEEFYRLLCQKEG